MLASGRGPCDEGLLRQDDCRVACAESARPYVLATAVLGSSMAFIDGTVLNVALPAIQRGLGHPLPRCSGSSTPTCCSSAHCS
jgi:hypothetical protein